MTTTRTASDSILVSSPFDGAELGSVPKLDANQVRIEVGLAQQAAATPHEPHERAAVLDCAVELLAQRHELFAQ
ncbi:MAG: hypothetical protein JWN41_1486, partial [Thermoleophilia bacterium]|nr:hypothetical protein [Thermoleophilia bacterium]